MIISNISLQEIIISSLIAIFLDIVFSETKYFHPLVGFGKYSSFIERNCNNLPIHHGIKKLLGCLSWLIAMLPLLVIILLISQLKVDFSSLLFSTLIDGIILYFVIGHNSLKQHALNVFNPLIQKNKDSLTNARKEIAKIVSRETSQLTEEDICRATVESIFENGHDAVIASLFWYAIGGIPMVILHRLANTLDAMWGYKNKQFIYFGWCAAKMDDLLGWPSAKVTTLLYAIQGLNNKRFARSLFNAKNQSQHYKSLNGGWVMAAGATILNIQLGGIAVYDNHKIQSVTLGEGDHVTSIDILRSIRIVSNAVWLWIGLLLFIVVLEKLIG